MLIASFFPWWSYSELGFSVSESGWGSPGSIWSLLAILLAIVMAGLVLAQRFGNVNLPDLGSVSWAQAWAGAGGALVVFMLLKAWRISDVPAGGFGIGFFLGVIATGLLAYGAYMKYTEEAKSGVQRA